MKPIDSELDTTENPEETDLFNRIGCFKLYLPPRLREAVDARKRDFQVQVEVLAFAELLAAVVPSFQVCLPVTAQDPVDPRLRAFEELRSRVARWLPSRLPVSNEESGVYPGDQLTTKELLRQFRADHLGVKPSLVRFSRILRSLVRSRELPDLCRLTLRNPSQVIYWRSPVERG